MFILVKFHTNNTLLSIKDSGISYEMLMLKTICKAIRCRLKSATTMVLSCKMFTTNLKTPEKPTMNVSVKLKQFLLAAVKIMTNLPRKLLPKDRLVDLVMDSSTSKANLN
jgi:hypothetical protein